MDNCFNKFKILTCQNNSVDLNGINIKHVISAKQKMRGSLSRFFNYNINKQEVSKKNKNKRKSIFLGSNNPSTVETSISSHLFDGAINIKKQNSYICRNGKPIQLTEIGEKQIGQKHLVYYVPKNIENKLIFDIIFGHYYFLSKNYKDIKKLEKFIFDLQNKFNKKLCSFYNKDNDYSNDNSEMSSSLRTEKDNDQMYNNNISQYTDIQDKLYYFQRLEDIMAIYSLILFYLVRNNINNKAKEIYLILIKQNMKYINYYENLIDYNNYIKEKNNKSFIKMYQSSLRTLFKLYSFLIKYGFLLHLSYYGNLFMKKYLSLSYIYYLIHLDIYRTKNFSIENENQIKHWFCYLNYFSSYFSIANYLPLKIPISLSNIILNIYKSIDDKYLELKDKILLLCTLYNKGILLYMNGQNEEAIISLKDAKNKLFMYIEDYETDEDIIPLRNSNQGILFVEQNNKHINHKFKNKGIASIQKLFKTVHKNKLLTKSCSNKQLYNNYNFRKQIININKKFEPFFISNSLFNITAFVKHFFRLYNIKEDVIEEKKNFKTPTFIKKPKKHENSDRKSMVQLKDFDKNRHINIPKIFKSPFLIKTELLIAEIELDKKNYRSAYTYVNHALAIITVFKKMKNIYYLNKYKNEQQLINEFLKIIENSNIKNYFDKSEKGEEDFIEDAEEYESIEKNELFEREHEIKEKININKKMLEEIEKFFIFFTSLSAYQIKVLNDTQPKAEKRKYLPILFLNQFKNCLSIKQIIAFENLHVMSLCRYIILKDPNKLILPNNLNISPLYFEKPELFSPRYFHLKLNNENKEKKKYNEILQKESHKIFKQILKSKKSNLYIQNFLNSNYNLVIKIIKKSTIQEVNKMIENPIILIKPVELYKKKSPNKEKKNLHRHKSEIGLSNKKILSKKLSIFNENDIKMALLINNKIGKKHLKTSNSDKFYEIVNYNNINRTCTSSENNNLFFNYKNKIKKKNLFKESSKESNIDSYSSYKLSLNNSFD